MSITSEAPAEASALLAGQLVFALIGVGQTLQAPCVNPSLHQPQGVARLRPDNPNSPTRG